jgi:glycosyltransferase involved in cell wall biosynthesis
VGKSLRLNWFNYKFLPNDGYGRMGLGLVRALLREGHQVRPDAIDALDKPAWFQRAQGIDFSAASVMLMPPHHMRLVSGRAFAFTMHESMHVPDGWAAHINTKSQWMIVPSPWLIEPFREAGVKLPIDVVPGGIEPDECPVLPSVSGRPFTIGCLGDRGGRKGHNLVWSAFYKAFDFKNKDVQLLIKCRPGSLPRLDFSYSSDSRLRIWKADVESVADVFAQMDAFFFPTHCEGFGMPPREAAACGIPTVVTRWSGTADDCDKWATPLEQFSLVESGMEDCGGLWAQPDLDEIVWRMRDMVEHQDEYKARALKAAQWMRDNATYAHAAEKLVKVVTQHLDGAPPDEGNQVQPKWVSANGHRPQAVPA